MYTYYPSHRAIKIKSFADYQYQVKYLVQEIKKVDKLKDVAVLYRNNSSSISLINEFDRVETPFTCKMQIIAFSLIDSERYTEFYAHVVYR